MSEVACDESRRQLLVGLKAPDRISEGHSNATTIQSFTRRKFRH